uniref:t-SNARE coiled-coil homology domain-containing protein n=1 Tax=viral metagenome TaxID=1070528 RepID=A0A6C0BEQ1_9ZZZZ
MEQIKKQDNDLESLGAVVDRLKDQSMAINEEVILDGKLLDNLDKDISKSTNKITSVNGNVKRMISSIDTGCNIYYIIGCLIIILFVLLLLIIYT